MPNKTSAPVIDQMNNPFGGSGDKLTEWSAREQSGFGRRSGGRANTFGVRSGKIEMLRWEVATKNIKISVNISALCLYAVIYLIYDDYMNTTSETQQQSSVYVRIFFTNHKKTSKWIKRANKLLRVWVWCMVADLEADICSRIMMGTAWVGLKSLIKWVKMEVSQRWARAKLDWDGLRDNNRHRITIRDCRQQKNLWMQNASCTRHTSHIPSTAGSW